MTPDEAHTVRSRRRNMFQEEGALLHQRMQNMSSAERKDYWYQLSAGDE